MSMEIEDWMRMKLPEGPKLPDKSRGNTVVLRKPQKKTNKQGRDIIFRTLLPCVFIFLVAYYAFAYQPFVATFYCETIIKWADKHPVFLHIEPREPASPLTNKAQIA